MSEARVTPEQVAEAVVAVLHEPWLDKRGLAAHYASSVRSVETALGQGMPHAVIFGRVKFQVSVVEAWLEQHGHLMRRDGGPDQGTVGGPIERASDAPTPWPRTRGDGPHASQEA